MFNKKSFILACLAAVALTQNADRQARRAARKAARAEEDGETQCSKDRLNEALEEATTIESSLIGAAQISRTNLSQVSAKTL